MLITKKIEVKIVSKNLNHFNDLNYNVKYGDIVSVNVTDLSKHSKIKVFVSCDICGKEKEKTYQNYLKQHTQNMDTCQQCKNIKTKKTMLKKYGVEHALQNKTFMDKTKKTMLEKYGVENPANSVEIRKKTKETVKEKYGVDYITQTEEFKTSAKKTKKEKYGNENYINFEQIKNTMLEKYGVEYPIQNDDIKNKMKETIIEKYGVENVSQLEEIKEKKKKTSLKNWGVDHPLQSDIIIKKLNITCMKRYGSNFPFGSKIIIDKTLQTNIDNGRWIKVEDRTDFYNYTLLVYKHTSKNKKKLIEEWNGYDYYSGEHILENFNLNSNDKNYPTIDHKKSVRYGFDNNISAKEISNINNLCVTTRTINSSKGEKTEFEFKNETKI